MTPPVDIASSLENIYISPLETCNLNCKLCYTHKVRNVLTSSQIISFIDRYQNYLKNELNLKLKSILFCGGEVFLLKDFPDLVNSLLSQGIFISIITNGTINRLKEISDPQNCQLLVSLDGNREVHDQNRGIGNFDKTIGFIRSALKIGFPTEIMFLVTQESYSLRDSLPEHLRQLLNQSLNLNYITQKTFFYTDCHPLSNQDNQNTALTPAQILDIKKNYPSIPSKSFGCFQLSLQSNGNLYGCCESPKAIGAIDDHPSKYINQLISSLTPCRSCSQFSPKLCHGCCHPTFLCGYKKELSLSSCHEVVQFLNQ